VQNTVFRTNALNLAIAPAGIAVDGATGTSAGASATGLTNGPSGTQSFVTGQSGGQANLFGNIPGKSNSIDVTVNLATPINAIARIVDQDVFQLPLVSGQPYPAAAFNCGQVWLGAVQNYIPGVRLKGDLRIAPAITKDGKLRIAKATVSSSQDTRVALTACLFPNRAYNAYNNAAPGSSGFNNSTTLTTIPGPVPNPLDTPAQDANGLWPVNSTALPIFFNQRFFEPSSPTYNNYGGNAPSGAACNSPAFPLVREAGLTGDVLPYTQPSTANGYSTQPFGGTVTVAGDINVPNLRVDVLIGDN
jgi:hypothetical protein